MFQSDELPKRVLLKNARRICAAHVIEMHSKILPCAHALTHNSITLSLSAVRMTAEALALDETVNVWPVRAARAYKRAK